MSWNEWDKNEMRRAYVETHEKMIHDGLAIVLVTADFTYGMGMLDFAKKYPDSFVNMGIAEQNMASFAAGLAEEGYIPFIHTFGVFACRRALDQIYLSGAYAQLNLNVVGADPGYTCGHNGGTHMSMEDTAIFRTIPKALIVEPTDETMLRSVLPMIAKHPLFSYIRLPRKKAIKIYDEKDTFELGKAKQLRMGKDVTIIASGCCVADALNAAEMLEERGIQAGVMDMFTIKPLDEEAVLHAANTSNLIVTVENAGKTGGLGGAVCELIAEHHVQTRVLRMGREDRFGEVGLEEELKDLYHLTAQAIVECVEGGLTND